eukprot:COSAG05_NODE_22320_length_265_cov_1.391566_1_plen_45_part_01
MPGRLPPLALFVFAVARPPLAAGMTGGASNTLGASSASWFGELEA